MSTTTTKRKILKTKFKKTPMCELLRDRPAQFFTYQDAKWLFVSLEAPEKFNDYHFEIDDFFRSPASTVDWLAHLGEKGWFDARDFFNMIHRFREAADCYFCL
jgi:hypothetical protein